MAHGVKVKITVDESCQAAFQKKIQDLADAAGKKGVVLKVKKIDASIAIEAFRKDLEKMLSGLQITGLKEFLGTDGIEQTYEKAAKSAEDAAKRIRDAQVKNSALGDINRSLSSAFQQISKLGGGTDVTEVLGLYNGLRTAIEETRELEGRAADEAIKKHQERIITLNQEIAKLQQAATTAKQAAAVEARAAQPANENSRLRLLSQINSYMQSNTKAASVLSDHFQKLIQDLNTTDLNTGNLKKLTTQFTGLKSLIDSMGLSGKNFGRIIAEAFTPSLITRGVAFTKVLQGLRVLFRNILEAVKEVDSAMTELKKVTDLGAASYNNYLKVASATSQKIGATLADTINATAEFARLGYTLDQSAAMGEAALVYQNVGDGIENITAASESLISTIKAFGIEASETMTIVDKFNEVGNNFAISSEGIGTALQKSASSLAAANNSLEETIALATGMNAVIQNPEVVGTALKSVSMFLRAAKVEAEEAGESTEGMADSVSKLRKQLFALTNQRVDIMKDDSTFKSTYQILKELSEVWGDIEDIDRSAILELIGGKRNATAVTSLLTNFADAEAALATAQNSAGSALAENEKYLDSIAGRIDVMNAKFQTFATTVLDSEVVKAFVDLAGFTADIGATLAEANAILPLIALSVTAISHTISKSKMQQLGLEAVGTFRVFEGEADKLKERMANLAVVTNQLSESEQVLLVKQLLGAKAAGLLTDEAVEQIVIMLGLDAAYKKATLGATGFAGSLKAIWSSMSLFSKVSLILTAISTLFTLIQTVFPDVLESVKNFFTPVEERIESLRGELKELRDEITDTVKSFNDLKVKTNDVFPRFIELANGVDSLGRNVSLTDEEYQEFLSLNNQIAELFPQLNAGVDESGNTILNLSYNANTLTESLSALLEIEREIANQKIADNFGVAIDKNFKLVKDYNRQLKALQSSADQLTADFERLSRGEGARSTDAISALKKFLPELTTRVTQVSDVEDAYDNGVRIIVDNIQNYISSGKLEMAYENALSGIENQIKAKQASIDDTLRELNSHAMTWVQSSYMYQAFDTEGQRLIAQKIASTMDFESLGKTSEEEVTNYLIGLMGTIKGLTPKIRNEIMSAFDLKSSFDNSDITYDAFVKGINKLKDYLIDESISTEFVDAVMSMFTESYEVVEKQIDNIVHGLNDKVLKAVNAEEGRAYREFIDLVLSGTSTDREIIIDILTNSKGPLSPQEILRLWEEEKHRVELEVEVRTSYDPKPLDEVFDSIAKYESILKSANEEMKNGGLSADTIKDIYELMTESGEDYLKYLEDENGEIRLNIALWESKALAIANSEIAAIETEIAKLREENIVLEEQAARLIALHTLKSKGFGQTSVGLDDLPMNTEAISELGANNKQIEELNKLLNIYRDRINSFGTDDSSSSSSKVEEYIADIDQFYKLEKELTQIQENRSDIERELNNTDNLKEKIALETALREIYKEESDAENALLEARRQQISENAKRLSSMGFDVSYDSSNHTFLINNLEHINELVVDSKGEYDSLQEATNEYRKEAEELIDTTENLNKSNVDSVNSIAELEHSVQESTTNIVGYLQDMVEQYRDSLGETTDAFDTLVSAVQSFNENGYLTVEMYETIMAMGNQYIGMLEIENGEIKLNEESFRKLTEAKINDLGVTQAMALIDTIKLHLDDAEALWRLAEAYDGAAESTWDMVYAELALLNLDNELDQAFTKQIMTMQQLTQSTIASIGQSMSIQSQLGGTKLTDVYQEQADALDDILDKTMDLVRYETEQRIDALEKQIDAYQRIVDLKKESLEKSKSEEDYEEEVANKVAKIAELQARIDKLSLDDSREAMVERSSLAEELKEAQKDLTDYQSDYAYNQQTESLDKMAEAYEQNKQQEIQVLESTISSTEKLYQQALQRLQGNMYTLLVDLMNWNTQAGNSINNDIVQSWNLATQAVQRYGSYASAVSSLEYLTSGNNYGNTIATTNFLPRYHSGGVVGGSSSLAQDEIMAVLQKRELVLDDDSQNSLYEIIDFQSELSKKLGVPIGNLSITEGLGAGITSVAHRLISELSRATSDGATSLVFEPHIDVTITGGVGSDSSSKEYGERIAQTTLDALYSAFERRGISSNLTSKLKP